MTQITTITQPGDIVVIVPRWIMRAVGFLSLFIGLSMAILIFLAGYVAEGVFLGLVMLALVPIALLFQYVVWRFYWYLVLMALLFQGACYFLTMLGVASRMPFRVSGSPLSAAYSMANRVDPIAGLVGLTLAALVTAALYRFYSLWRSGGRGHPAPAPAASSDDDLFFDESQDTSLMGQVVRKLEKTGRKAEVKGDTIHVFKDDQLVGIVRVIDRAGAISPLLVNDVAKQRDRIGVRTAYLATSGSFSSDVRSLASSLGIQLMKV